MAGQKISSVSKSITNLVIVGRTGNGKSSTGNTILGQKLFVSNYGAAGCTMRCEMYRGTTQDGLLINVIDTPGFFDMSVSTEYISEEIFKCLTLAEEGIHAMLFVLSARNRISEEEESTLNLLKLVFGSKILDYCIVVFTGGDRMEEEDITLDDYLYDGCPEFMTRLIRTCYGRKVLFHNRTKDENKKAKQLKHLWAHVADVRKQNRGIPFTKHMHLDLEIKTLRENAEAHEKEMCVLEDKLKQNAKHEREIRQVEDELKQSAIAHEREMREMKDEFQQNQYRQMVENMLKQNSATHEKRYVK